MKQHSWTMQTLCSFITFSFLLAGTSAGRFSSADYYDALEKSILFFEGQRSGRLPGGQRVDWRGDSALSDGHSIRADLDLAGGYYDAGDNIKFGLPMAFTTTLLSWSVIEFGEAMGDQKQHAEEAIRWGTDYLLKAAVDIGSGVLYVQVGDAHVEHPCWGRPEDLDPSQLRPVYSVSSGNPGSDVAGETAAALAAASIVFQKSDPSYSHKLLSTSRDVFVFAKNHRKSYSDSIASAVSDFYKSSGDIDELMWSAGWLYHASGDEDYLNYIAQLGDLNDDQTFSWDNKKPGVKVILSKIFFETDRQDLQRYQEHANNYVCNVLNGKRTPGGLYYLGEWSNLQYLTASFLLGTYAKQLKSAQHPAMPNCVHSANDLIEFVRQQVDYVLGDNPKRMSYMVGFGDNYPLKIHHRGASIVSVKKYPKSMGCYGPALTTNDANPNIHVGAITGGPDESDEYEDNRQNYQQSEPATYINAAFVGVVASLLAQ